MSGAAGFHSILFVPGSRPDRFSKALASGADLVCIDLEDAVAPGDKDAARYAVVQALPELEMGRVAVRINALATADGLRDLLALRDGSGSPRPCSFRWRPRPAMWTSLGRCWIGRMWGWCR